MIRGSETSAARQAGLDRAIAVGAIAVALSGDRDEDAALAAGLNDSAARRPPTQPPHPDLRQRSRLGAA